MRAILLAAGMGTRLRPLTNTTPKSLIEVNGKSLIERQIEYLKEVGIDEIFILTGYLAHKFDGLKNKYDVKLIYNDKYDIYNNIYSMYLVRDYLSDSYVIDADVYLNRNFFEKELTTSIYFSGEKKGFCNEWILLYDNNDKVYDIKIVSGQGYILSGVSYWTPQDGAFIKDKLEKVIAAGNNFGDLYWDNIVKDNLQNLNIYIRKISGNDWFEIDCLDDLTNVKRHVEWIRQN
jgi:CTP:phosphocholine cytidylyltransferase-like protein